ncbi:hypothetical protein Tco_0179062 [Tanacetum coccineum]
MEGASRSVSLGLSAGSTSLNNPGTTHRDNSQNKVCFGGGGSGGGLDDEDDSDLMIDRGINTHQHCSEYEACLFAEYEYETYIGHGEGGLVRLSPTRYEPAAHISYPLNAVIIASSLSLLMVFLLLGCRGGGGSD